MPRRIEKTVFISYRRTNFYTALAVYQDLTQHGYDVFFDYNSIKSGDFEQVILQNIKGRAHFVVILTPSAMDRCNEPDDWLRREIELALDEKRNIVPLFLEGFTFKNPALSRYLTGKLEFLRKYNGMTVPAEYFEAAMDKLRNEFLNVPLSAIIHPVSTSVDRIVTTQRSQIRSAAKVNQDVLLAQEEEERLLQEAMLRTSDGFFSVDPDSKIKCYTEAIYIKPDYAMAHHNRGVARSEKGDLDGAIQDISEAIRLAPSEGLFYYSRAHIYATKGNMKSSLVDINEAIRLNPNKSDYYIIRGTIWEYIERSYYSAIQDYEKYIALGGKDITLAKQRIAQCKQYIS